MEKNSLRKDLRIVKKNIIDFIRFHAITLDQLQKVYKYLCVVEVMNYKKWDACGFYLKREYLFGKKILKAKNFKKNEL